MDESSQDKSPPRAGVRAFRANLTGFPHQARLGRSFLVMPDDEVLAGVGPLRAEQPRRRAGALRGKIRLAVDFDVLPPDVLASMEGEEG